VISTGLLVDFKAIPGAFEAVSDPYSSVGSSYLIDYAEKWNTIIRSFSAGKLVFTEPAMPMKCAGAPQKILYLTEDLLNQRGVRKHCSLEFRKTISVQFSVKKYSDRLAEIAKEKGIKVLLENSLVEVKGKDKIAVFMDIKSGELQQVSYDALHIVPPMKAPAFIRQSGLSDKDGFVEVDKHTLRHLKHANVWSLGDSSSLPTSKTAAAAFA